MLAGLTALLGGGGGGGGSFESIATATGTGSTVTLNLNSIPSTYKHLQLRITANDGAGATAAIRVNSDSGSNYTLHRVSGDGTSVYASGSTAKTSYEFGPYYGLESNINSVSIIDILDYSNATKNKTFRTFFGINRDSSGGQVYLSSGLWQNTSAITSISLIGFGSYYFTASTKIALYGIKG